MGAAQAMQQISYLQGDVSGAHGGQQRPEPTALERGAGAEEREAWEEEWDEDERVANGWYENAAYGSAVDPAEGSDVVGGSLGGGNPSTPRMGARARDISRSPRGKKTKKAIKWEMKGPCEVGRREASGRREERRKKQSKKGPQYPRRNSQGKDPRTFEENSQGGDLGPLGTNSQGRDPRTLKEPVERWRVQKKRKEKKWK